MYLLRDNKIIIVDVSEDAINNIKSIKTVEELKKEYNSSSIVKDKISTLTYYRGNKSGWVFEITQSQFTDDSGIGHGNGIHETKGDAIMVQLRSGYKVYINDKEITL